MLNLSNLDGEESFPATALGEAGSVSQEFVGEDEMVVIRGTYSWINVSLPPAPPHSPETSKDTSSTILLRGGSFLQLDEMERSVHDALCAVKRVLESGSVRSNTFFLLPQYQQLIAKVVPGGGAVETGLAMHLETFAESLGTKEQLAILGTQIRAIATSSHLLPCRIFRSSARDP